MPLPLDPALVATTDAIPGYRIVRTFGIAEGVGLSVYTGVFPNGRRNILAVITREAILNMLAVAAAQGANAIVGHRYATPSSSRRERIVMAYGTAVLVEKL